MTAYRTALALAASTLAFVAAQADAQVAPAPAETVQDAPAVAEPDDTAPVVQDEIIVTGTRAVGRSRLDSVSPVDVLSGASLQRQGTTELGAAL